MGKFKKKSNNTIGTNLKETPFAQMGQDYGICTKSLGDRRFDVYFTTGETKLGSLRGGIKKNKKSWVSRGSVVLVSFRSFQDDKVDILYVYNDDEVKYLYKSGEMSKDWRNSVLDETTKDENRGGIDIEDDDDDCAFNLDEI
jgi:initiation factor 1A